MNVFAKEMEGICMLIEKCVTLTKYQFSLDGVDFAEGYIFSDGDTDEDSLFRLGTLRHADKLPVPEGAFLQAEIENGDLNGKLMFQKDRFVLSVRNKLSCVGES